MNRWQSGYTIVEVMLFLAISTGLFVMMSALISGQQSRAQFTASVREVESTVQSIINDVDTGYFPGAGGRINECPSSSAANLQGTNDRCIFAGKAVQFGVSGNPGQYNVYTLVGRRLTTATPKTDVKDIEEAKAKVVSDGSFINTSFLKSGLVFSKVSVGTACTNCGGIAIVPTFGQKSGPTRASVLSTSGSAVLAAVTDSSLGMNSSQFAAKASKLSNADIADAANGVLICVKEPGSSTQIASISFGGQLGSSIETKFDTEANAAGCS